jgi:hypothetical protein
MNMRRMLFGLLITALAGAAMFAQSRAGNQPAFQGVWRIAEVTTTGPNASTNARPQPSLYIFAGRHYSIIRVNGDKPRPNLPQDVAKATAAELNAVYGAPLTAQSGTYEVSGGNVTLRPTVAKNPATMAPNNFTTYSFKLDGRTLVLTNTSTPTGPVANPTTYKLERIE